MLGPLSPEKRRLQGELRPAIQYLKGGYKKERGRLFRKVCSDRSSGGGFNLKEGIFRLDIRKIFFFFYDKKSGCKALDQVAQRGGGCPIPGDVQGQV